MREKVAVKSSYIGFLSQIIAIILSIINTRIFVRYLGIEIRGINGLLSNCLNMLQLAEFGFGTAIIYALYQPLIDKNYSEIRILMSFYKKLYKYIGIIIVFLGIIMSLFLDFFITDSTFSMEYIRIIFFIQLLTSASTYFIAYKRNLLYADQRQYVSTLTDSVINVLATIIKIMIILVYKSYIAYLLVAIFQVLISNICIHIYCLRVYPYLKGKVSGKYDKMKQLKENIKNLMIGKLAGFVYGSTDNLIISRVVGISMVGYMSNYYQIVMVLKGLSGSITQPIQPMIGNYIREYKDVEKSYRLFQSYTFIRYCIANVVTVGTVVMSTQLIDIWLGKEYALPLIFPVLMAIDTYIAIVHGPTGEFISVLGLFRNDRNMSIIALFINLLSSLVLAYFFGAPGVLIGTVLSQVYYWAARSRIVFKQYFNKNIYNYLMRIIFYTGIVVLDISLLLILESNLTYFNGLVKFLLMCFLCVTVSVVSIVFAFGWTEEFKFMKNFLFRNIIKRERKI